MDWLGSSNWLHSALLLIMILLIITGRRNGVFESRRRMAAERASLRAALIAELRALRTVYRINLNLITAGAPQLVPGKAYFSVYRGNMHRLLGLTPAEVAAVVTAHAACNTLESGVGIGMRIRTMRRDAALSDSKRLDLLRLQRHAASSVRAALMLLEQEAAAAHTAPVQRWWRWWQGKVASLQGGWLRPGEPVPVLALESER